MIKNLLYKTKHIRFLCIAFLLIWTGSLSQLRAQGGSEVYNDAPIRLRVWLDGVWSDANCSEVLYPSLFGLLDDNVKYVFSDLKIRAANGTGYVSDNFPNQNIFNLFPINMTFSYKDDKMAKFYAPNSSKFKMLNPWYPFKDASMNITAQKVVDGTVSKYNPPILGATLSPSMGGSNPIGLDASHGNKFLLYDKTFTKKAPDRFQYFLDGAWESDADMSESEAGIAICAGAFGLPQVADRSKLDNNISPLLTLLMLNEYGPNFITDYVLRIGGCSDLFGFINFDPDDFFGIIVNLLITDYDDSWANKRQWSDDEAFIRGTPPGQTGYFATRKLKATSAADRDYNGEGYMLLFSYQWDWGGTTYNEIPTESPSVKIQAPLCPTIGYEDATTSAPIHVEAWLDGLFEDQDHEGYEFLTLSFFGLFDIPLDLGFAYCADINLPNMSSWVGGSEEMRFRGKAWSSQQGEGEPGWNPTIAWGQDYPDWHYIAPSTSGAKILDKTYTTQTGMRSFDVKLEAWEADCPTDNPAAGCDQCVFAATSRCCIINMPSFLGGGCLIPGYEPGVSNNTNYAASSAYKINYRNSPPDTYNYYYVPIRVTSAERKSYIARIKYKWTLEPPLVTITDPPYDTTLCPGQKIDLHATATNATFYQWQYVEVDTPSGPLCPSIADDQWINATGATANCPTYTNMPTNFTKTRIYRLKAFNRAGDGSRTPNGDKFAYAYSKCIRIQKLPQTIPMTSPLVCGTASEPTVVRSSSSYTFSPVLPPDSGSVDVPGITYSWAVNFPATVTPNTGENVVVKFPPTGGVNTTVTMTSNFTTICGSPLTRSVSCYFVTADGGCDTLTGVIYVSPTATSSGVGSISNPYSLAQAFQYARGEPRVKHIKMLEGTYNISSTTGPAYTRTDSALIMTDGLVVEGGYQTSTDADGNLIWVKRSNARSTINSSILERVNDSTIHVIGFRAVGTSGWTIQNININTSNAPARDATSFGKGKGLSNYGILVAHCSDYTIQNVTADARMAGKGSDGETPSFNNPVDSINLDLSVGTAPAASAAGFGDPTTYYPDWSRLNTGGPPNQRRLPGRGGQYGTAYNPSGDGETALYKYLYFPAGIWGNGGTYSDPTWGPGQPGTSPNNAFPPPNDIVYADLASMSTYFVPRVRSLINRIGESGGGGGGGAGNGPGGYGGAGGIGGRGGFPGYAGGGSFSIWIVNSTGAGISRHMKALNNVSISIPRGLGGVGEMGQVGGAGYNGGYKGGNGGQGQRGDAGEHGYALFLYENNSLRNQLPADFDSTIAILSDYGAGCTNSVFTIDNIGGTGGWANFGLPVFDITSNKGSTDNSMVSPKLIYYNTLGAKNLQKGGTFYNQIYVRYDRELPTIDLPDNICSGDAFNMTSDPKSDMTTDYRWSIQKGNNTSIISATVPTPNFTFTTKDVNGVVLPANNTSVPETYQIKYQAKHACCGWSIPVYKYIQVYPQIRNVIGPNDSVSICDEGTAGPFTSKVGFSVIATNPTYQWVRSIDGGSYDTIPGATGVALPVQSYDSTGIYRYVRLIGSTTATCRDSSNVITVFVTPNFTDNNISDPTPTVCVGGRYPISSGGSFISNGATTNSVNIGFMSGSDPIGPGTARWYQWQYGTRENGPSNPPVFHNYSESQPAEGGNTSDTRDFDPGNSPLGTTAYGTANNVFFNKPSQGEIYFRRIVGMKPDGTACKDTSDYVTAYIPYGADTWQFCINTAFPNSSKTTRANCDAFLVTHTGTDVDNLVTNNVIFTGGKWHGGPGKCLIIAPDTVCLGDGVALQVPDTKPGITRGNGNVYAWYKVEGGPYNNDNTTGLGNFCRFNSTCTNPLDNANCTNDKPVADSTKLVGIYNINPDSSGNAAGMTLNQVLANTTTYYVNIFDACFSDANFRVHGKEPNYYYTNSGNTWQRKTIVVREPIIGPDSITATPNQYCSTDAPDSINLHIDGGYLGNAGYYQIYKGDTLSPSSLIYTSEKSDSINGMNFADYAVPTTTTKYFARIYTLCDTSSFVEVTVRVDNPSTDPISLDGDDASCDAASVTLTVTGGSLGDHAQWVLYNGNPFTTGVKIDSSVGRTFNVSPSVTTTYYVRAESPLCGYSDTVSHQVLAISSASSVCGCGYIAYAPDNTTTTAKEVCTDPSGWTWYASDDKPYEYLFAIQKKPGSSISNANTNDFTAEVNITVTPNPTTQADVFYAEEPCEANFVMPRYWNLTFTSGSTNGFVKVRFFFRPTEFNATHDRAVAWEAANASACPEPMIVGPGEVFENTDHTNFNPGPVTGINTPVGPSTDIQPTTINNFALDKHYFSNLPYSDVGDIDGIHYAEVAWDNIDDGGGGVAVRVSRDLAVLPITLVQFTGTLMNQEILLSWVTASELNNDYFVVEKSSDATNWTSLGSVRGHGTTYERNEYSLLDPQPYQGNNYYRLKQVDYDGTVHYSRIILINFLGTIQSENTFSVQPNPTSGSVMAIVNSDVDYHVNFRIINAQGQLMGTKDVTLGKGENHIRFDLSYYPSGSYTLSFTDHRGRERIVKVVKQ